MCFFKRVLPFALTFILGIALSGAPGAKYPAFSYDQALVEEAITGPVVVRSLPDAGYTAEASRNHFEGLIRLYVLCDAQGNVSAVEPENYLPYGQTEEAIRAAQGIQFSPATSNGRGISIWMPVEYSFKAWPDAIYDTGFAFLPEVRTDRWVLEYQLNSRTRKHF